MRQLWFLGLLVLATGCASARSADGQGAPDSRYPRRGAACELAVFYTGVPGVAAWDDIGIVEVACHINDAGAECLRRLRNESCRMGGDVIYNVPRNPFRPTAQVLVYRAQVAHTRRGAPRKTEDPDLPPPASAEESSGPIVPLPSANAGPLPSPLPSPAPATSGAGGSTADRPRATPP